MFDIEYKGGNTVVITTKKITVVVDPKQSLVGLKDIAGKGASVQLATEQRFATDGAGYQLVVDGPGEYEIADVSVRGIAAQRHLDTSADPLSSTLYQLEIAGVRIALLGNVAPKLSEEQLEAIGVVDVAIVPVGGGGYTLDPTSATAMVRQLDPKVIIPVHYADPALKYEVPQENLEVFLKESGVPHETTAKYKIKGESSLPATLMAVVIERS